MYLLVRAGGGPAREALWKLVLTGRLEVADLSRAAVERSARLMAKYADRPMDPADATLVAIAEQRGERRIFTLDDDFRIYRMHGRRRFEVVPG
jgi:predicted nucleic acid-binding protein